MGSTHLQAYAAVPDAEIVAVASQDEKKLAGDLSGISGNLDRQGPPVDFSSAARYRTFEELIGDPRVEAVDLCTPSYLHASQAIAALEAGKHVLVEKPMALSAPECDEMLEAARASGKALMVAQVLRFWPDYVAARDLIRSGRVGGVKVAFFRRKCGAPAWSPWMRDRAKSGGGVFDLLIHDFDFCQHLFGPPQTVSATGEEAMDRGIDLVEARLQYASGVRALISGGWHHLKSYPFSMEFSIVCEGGTLDFHSGLRRLTLYREDGESEEVELPTADGFQAEVEAFVEACQRSSAPEDCRPEDSAEAVRMALAMLESRARDGEPVRVEPGNSYA